jgi:prolyl-tRNA synthetase
MTFASGGAFTQFSHEFQTITDGGEDSIYINREKNIAINSEILNDETLKNLGVAREELEKVDTAEVGNIFNFGTKKCEELGLYYRDSQGKNIPVWLGSYGIGITRLMGVIVEKFSDEKGIVWPKSIAPFTVHLISIGESEEVINTAEKLYTDCQKENIEILYDDRQGKSVGEKFAEADLIGIPYRIIISEKTLKDDSVELKERNKQEAELVKIKDLIKFLKNA